MCIIMRFFRNSTCYLIYNILAGRKLMIHRHHLMCETSTTLSLTLAFWPCCSCVLLQTVPIFVPFQPHTVANLHSARSLAYQGSRSSYNDLALLSSHLCWTCTDPNRGGTSPSNSFSSSSPAIRVTHLFHLLLPSFWPCPLLLSLPLPLSQPCNRTLS